MFILKKKILDFILLVSCYIISVFANGILFSKINNNFEAIDKWGCICYILIYIFSIEIICKYEYETWFV